MNFGNEEIVALKAAKTQTLVFWDLVECPIPEGMDVVTVSGNIRDALKKEGYQGQTVIRSFGYTSQYSKALVELVHLPKRDKEGDEEARRQMILGFLAHLLCGAVAHLAPLSLMLIMGDISGLLQFRKAFHVLRWSHYNCMLVQPRDSPMLFENSVTAAWLWDTLSSGGKPLRSPPLVVSNSSSQEWKDVLCETNFPMLHAPTESARRQQILVDFMNVAIGGRQVNLMLIMPDLTGHPEFLHCFKCLKETRNINVLVAQPHRDNVSEELLSSVEAVWLWSSLSRGDLPIGQEDQGASTDSEA